VFDAPAPPKPLLPLFKFATSVQLVPFQDSTSAVLVGRAIAPPKIKADVIATPADPACCLT
jgi:hypothetical protein